MDTKTPPPYEGDVQPKANSRSNSAQLDPEIQTATADDLLGALGYDAEMTRNRSTLGVAFMSFILASVPYGLATTFYYPLLAGGPVCIIYGWILLSAIICCVAISLGEITSVYPTAGGVYYQAFMLAPKHCRRIVAWITGWCYVLGTVVITLAVNFGTALFIYGCANIFSERPKDAVFPGEPYQIVLLFIAVTLVTTAISTFGNKWLPILDQGAVIFTFIALFVTTIAVLAVAKNGRRDAEFVFTRFEPNTGYPGGWSFMVGLLQAAYTTSSTGMVISMCEEVKQPSTQVPKALIGTIGLNFLAGLVFLIPLVFVFPDIKDLVNDPYAQPVPAIFLSSLGNRGGAFALSIPLIVLAIMCGTGCETAASRSVWAFSRDGAIPGSQWLSKVNPTLELPVNAMIMSMTVQLLLGLIYFGSTAAFNAFSGAGVIFLTVSYVIPIFVSLIDGRRKLVDAPFNMGTFGLICNVVAVGWSCLAVPLFCFPSSIPTTKEYMNYASVVFVGFVGIAAGWYYIWGKANYVGPPAASDEEIARRRSSVVAGIRRQSVVPGTK